VKSHQFKVLEGPVEGDAGAEEVSSAVFVAEFAGVVWVDRDGDAQTEEDGGGREA
jgi:hypothetical protein